MEIAIDYDVVIAGGGPAGLAAALTLGRARKRVLLCDAGPPRNAAAVHVHNFVTRDGIAPSEFRRIGREQLSAYANVEVRDVRVREIRGRRDAFTLQAGTETLTTRRILLCTGMIDLLPDLAGARELWGTSVFQCPYCHGWEVQDRRFAYLARDADGLSFALLLRGWTRDVVALTDGRFSVSPETAARLAAGGVPLEERPLRRLVADNRQLTHVDFADGARIALEVLFMHPAQRQVELVQSLGLTLDAKGLVQVDETTRETSAAGIYAGGDLVLAAQGALPAAASGLAAAAALNRALTIERATAGGLA